MLGKTVMVAAGILAMVLLSACGASSAGDRQSAVFDATPTETLSSSPTPLRESTPIGSPEHTDKATPQPPSPTAAPPTPTNETSPGDFFWGAIGTITSIESGGAIYIVEHPEDPNAGEQYIVSIMPTTQIQKLTALGAEPRNVADLKVGERVIVAFDGPVATSFPAQATASAVVIMRTETQGPLDPSDTVTVTFTHRVVTLEPPMLPGDDAFILKYTITGGTSIQLFFCGEGPSAPETCQGDGAAYEVTVEVPRGAELHYAVYRLPGGSTEQQELVEQGREVVDMALFTRSHYRYGASNPGGYD